MLIASRWTMQSLFGCYLSQPSLGKICLSNTPVAPSSYMDSKEDDWASWRQIASNHADPATCWWNSTAKLVEWSSMIQPIEAAAHTRVRPQFEALRREQVPNWWCSWRKRPILSNKNKIQMSIWSQFVRGHRRSRTSRNMSLSHCSSTPGAAMAATKPEIKSRRGHLKTLRTATFCRPRWWQARRWRPRGGGRGWGAPES
jgi:hypothetical protein